MCGLKGFSVLIGCSLFLVIHGLWEVCLEVDFYVSLNGDVYLTPRRGLKKG